MPPWPKPVSQNQRKAMYAAAAGHSTIGIAKKVGAEFVKGDSPGKLPKKAPKPETSSRSSIRSDIKSAMRRGRK